jgi:hypothetical protein
VKQGSLVKELFESRQRAEEEAAATSSSSSSSSSSGSRMPPRNRLHVSSLVMLLEERLDVGSVGAAAGAATAGSMRQLAEKYGMDVELLESLVRFVNVPSVREGESVHRNVRDAENAEDVAITEVSLSFFFF